MAIWTYLALSTVTRPRHGAVYSNFQGRGQLGMAVLDEIRVAVLSLGVGLGVVRAIEPSLPVGALVNTLRVLVGLPAD